METAWGCCGLTSSRYHDVRTLNRKAEKREACSREAINNICTVGRIGRIEGGVNRGRTNVVQKFVLLFTPLGDVGR